MTVQQAIATLVGAFLFPFIIRMAWGQMVEKFGPIGGWIAAAMIVGTAWTINHGVGLITQSGSAWVDMGLAAGIGVFVASVARGGKAGKAKINLLAALVGGILGGLILSFIL
ncbi:Lin0368 family putative glycerol transporter subunit [Streptococcus suis]